MNSIKDVTAIVLAGGNSSRMGKEKAFLEIGGRFLIEYVYNQLLAYFEVILISANNKEKYSFLGAEVIPDKIPGTGPLMGIASALEASKSEINFIIACDIPDIDISYVKKMIHECKDYDGVVPIKRKSKYEPLYAVYKKSMLKAMNEVLSSGNNKISEVFKLCNLKYITLKDTSRLKNLNTVKDYEEYLNTKCY